MSLSYRPVERVGSRFTCFGTLIRHLGGVFHWRRMYKNIKPELCRDWTPAWYGWAQPLAEYPSEIPSFHTPYIANFTVLTIWIILINLERFVRENIIYTTSKRKMSRVRILSLQRKLILSDKTFTANLSFISHLCTCPLYIMEMKMCVWYLHIYFSYFHTTCVFIFMFLQ